MSWTVPSMGFKPPPSRRPPGPFREPGVDETTIRIKLGTHRNVFIICMIAVFATINTWIVAHKMDYASLQIACYLTGGAFLFCAISNLIGWVIQARNLKREMIRDIMES